MWKIFFFLMWNWVKIILRWTAVVRAKKLWKLLWTPSNLWKAVAGLVLGWKHLISVWTRLAVLPNHFFFFLATFEPPRLRQCCLYPALLRFQINVFEGCGGDDKSERWRTAYGQRAYFWARFMKDFCAYQGRVKCGLFFVCSAVFRRYSRSSPYSLLRQQVTRKITGVACYRAASSNWAPCLIILGSPVRPLCFRFGRFFPREHVMC